MIRYLIVILMATTAGFASGIFLPPPSANEFKVHQQKIAASAEQLTDQERRRRQLREDQLLDLLANCDIVRKSIGAMPDNLRIACESFKIELRQLMDKG